MNDGLINVLILLAIGAGSLLQWWMKQQRAARAAQPRPHTRTTVRPAAPAPDAEAPAPAPAAGSLEDVFSQLFGGEPKVRPAMDWRPISAPRAHATTLAAAAAADEAATKAGRAELPQQVLTSTVSPRRCDKAGAPAPVCATTTGFLLPADLRRAFIMKELLDPPVSLR